MKTHFQGLAYEVVFTEHAKPQVGLRGLTEPDIIEVISTGEVKPKATQGKFWGLKDPAGRKDNLISVSIAIEKPHLIVIPAMVNWRPQ